MIKVLAIAVLMGALTLFAQDQPQRPQWSQGPRGPRMGPQRGGIVMTMDTNKDGTVSKKEVLTWFNKMDVNKDGILCQRELNCLQLQRRGGGPPTDRPYRGGRGQRSVSK